MSETSRRVLATDYDTRSNAPRLYGEAVLLCREVEALEAEVAVLNGTACKDEQAAGNGPCGVCTGCFRERVRVLERAMNDIRAWTTDDVARRKARQALEGK